MDSAPRANALRCRRSDTRRSVPSRKRPLTARHPERQLRVGCCLTRTINGPLPPCSVGPISAIFRDFPGRLEAVRRIDLNHIGYVVPPR